MLLLPALLLAPAAGAADLDLELSRDDVVLASLTVHDVEQARIPPMLVASSTLDCPLAHPDLLVTLTPVPVDDGAAWRIELLIETLRPDRRGRLHREVLSQPVVTTRTGQPASLAQGSRVPYVDQDGEVRFEDHAFRLDALITD